MIMGLPQFYPPANRSSQWRPQFAGGGSWTDVEKLCLHTTESPGWPGYPTFAPHLTFNPWTLEWRQHLPLTRSATTLADPGSTAIRENRDKIIQVEIVAYCDPKMVKKYGHDIDKISDSAVQEIAALAAWLHQEGGMPLVLAEPWVDYPDSYGNSASRMSGPEYDRFEGILGHQHVSGNDHGDPGDPPWLQRMLDSARSIAGVAPAPSAQKGFRSMRDIYQKYDADTLPPQPLVKGVETTLKINKKGDVSLVVGKNSGIDVVSTVAVSNPTGSVTAWYRIVECEKKGGKSVGVYHDREAVTFSGSGGFQVSFKGGMEPNKDRPIPDDHDRASASSPSAARTRTRRASRSTAGRCREEVNNMSVIINNPPEPERAEVDESGEPVYSTPLVQREPVVLPLSILTGLAFLFAGIGGITSLSGYPIIASVAAVGSLTVAAVQVGVQFWIRGQVTPV